MVLASAFLPVGRSEHHTLRRYVQRSYTFTAGVPTSRPNLRPKPGFAGRPSVVRRGR